MFSRVTPRCLPVAVINGSNNNTIINLFRSGKLLFSTSAGRLGYMGSAKGTKAASQHALRSLASYVTKENLNRIDVMIKGIGTVRANTLRELTKAGVQIGRISDCPMVAFNGCRMKRKKR